MWDKELKDEKKGAILHDIEKALQKMFVRAQECIEDGNEENALEIYLETREIGKLCDDSMKAIILDEQSNLKTPSAVVFALNFRYLKRINAHLRNIVSSVINPYDRIGYKPQKKPE